MELLIFFSLAFFCNSLYLSSAERVVTQNSSSPTTSYHVGVILDMGSPIGKIGNECISMALSDFYAINTHYKTRLVLHNKDSKGEPLLALSSAIVLLENDKIQAIIGPQTSDEAEFLVHLGDKARLPIVTFSATSSFLSHVKTPYFVSVATNDNAQVKAIAAIVREFRWRQVILIHEDTNYGNGVIPYLICAFEEINSHVPYRSVISPRVTDDQITIELQKLMTMSTRVFVVHMSSSLASRIFLKVKELGMMSEGYAWIITDGITNVLNLLDSSVIKSMKGVIGVRPYIAPSELLCSFMMKWKSRFPKEEKSIEMNESDVFCLWAYDALWALARASEKVGLKIQSTKPKSSSKFTYSDPTPISKGPELLNAILQNKFNGVSGKFQLTKGQIQPHAFQIVNIIENAGKRIGFWTPEFGISQVLNSASMTCLEHIIWPGESSVIPKGWTMPVSGKKKMRVGVPAQMTFQELVKVDRDLQTGAVTATGFCIDVFKAAVEMLPYDVPYEFIPLTKGYDDLVLQVYHQELDAVVGDITITANRSLNVDFTLPYTDMGVAMVVPIETGTKSMWIFLEPLTLDLWLVTGAFLIWTGWIIWVIEREINSDFKGSAAQQVGMIFWFSFSTIVFAHREKLVSNVSKFVVLLWLFVVLILTSSYTASLSSLLTVNQIKKKSSVIYPERLKNFDFGGHGKKLPYDSAKDYAINALDSDTGFVDELPYIKIFLAKYGDHYAMIESEFHPSGGFGFVFPKGSPLVSDISWAITKLREDGKLDLIERTWFKDHSLFKKKESSEKPNSLSFYSFRGLFLVMGVSSALALIVFYVSRKKELTSKEESQVDSLVIHEPLSDHDISAALTGENSIEKEDNLRVHNIANQAS